jgi:ribose transport system ATP-binding protein
MTSIKSDPTGIILNVQGISKAFPGVQALDNVSLTVRAGEVTALVGENGAGKSTLMKIINGIYPPDSGQILLAGQKVKIRTPLEAKSHGIAMIHQELSLVDDLSVAENIFLGLLPRKRFGRVDWASLHRQTQVILDRLNVQFLSEGLVKDLSVAQKQLVEIARSLVFDAKVVIFDEPTTSLTDHETLVLFDVIHELKSRRVGIVYISHKFDEIFELSNRIIVLRDGKFQSVLETSSTNENQVVEQMIGRRVDLQARSDFLVGTKTRLKVQNLSSKGAFTDINFEVRSGEILGLYGLVGSGRSEILETVFGLRSKSSGEIMVDGYRLTSNSPQIAMSHGIGLIPEDRKKNGLALTLSCDRNISMSTLAKQGLFANSSAERSIFKEYRKSLNIKAPHPTYPVGSLSGGNQQKIVLGKWLATSPRILLIDEPTRGIDVGSKAQIHRLLRQLAQAGYAILVVSSEMPEIIAVSDRILCLYNGSMVCQLVGSEISEKSIGAAISGTRINGSYQSVQAVLIGTNGISQ